MKYKVTSRKVGTILNSLFYLRIRKLLVRVGRIQLLTTQFVTENQELWALLSEETVAQQREQRLQRKKDEIPFKTSNISGFYVITKALNSRNLM